MTVCENDCFGAELEIASVRVWQAGGVLAFAVAGGLRVLDTWIVSCLSSISSKTASGGGGPGRRTTEASTRSRTPAMDNPANPNIHNIVKAQIVFLLSTLTEDNFERNQAEIRSVGRHVRFGARGMYADNCLRMLSAV